MDPASEQYADVVNRLREVASVNGGMAMLRGWTVFAQEQRNIRITSSPQRPFRPLRLAMRPEDVPKWIIHNIEVGGVMGGVMVLQAPMYPTTSQDGIGRHFQGSEFPRLQTHNHVTLLVEYVGDRPEGETFTASMVGLNDMSSTDFLPFVSERPVPPGLWALGGGSRVVVAFDDDRVIQFEERAGRLGEITPLDVSVVERPSAPVQWTASGGRHRQRRVVVPERDGIDLAIVPGVPDALVKPICVSLHVATAPRLVLFGVDDATSNVVFEVGHTADVDPSANSYVFAATLDTAGYIPWWWS